PNRRLLDYPYLQQLRDMLPSLGLSALMAALGLLVIRLGLSDLLTLLFQVPAGVAVYVLGSRLLRLDSFEYILDMLKKLLHRKEA
ncbi:MAG: lipopolysaccharide biosynthesis protein, partial [Oscillospiraceae bacterium]|nr:lipopolysaccharide biosynthesis protein [Oscillospiraceae bacterium]